MLAATQQSERRPGRRGPRPESSLSAAHECENDRVGRWPSENLALIPMRLLLVGAFPYPHDQGSQIYFQEQAIALREAGAEVSLLTYGAPAGIDYPDSAEPRESASPERRRALEGFTHITSPEWTAPSSKRSGPSWAKPLADFGLVMTLRDAVASRNRHDAYDAILTHNAEATLAALHGLDRRRPPILYCIHTLLGEELSAYLRGPRTSEFSVISQLVGPAGPLAGGLDRVGAELDRWMARRVDGWLSLTQSSERVMKRHSSKTGERVPPAIPDPRSRESGLTQAAIEEVAGELAGNG